MNPDSLSTAFGKIQEELILKEYLKEVSAIITDRTVSREKVDHVLTKNNIHFDIAKVEFIQLLLEYIQRALDDGILTNDEKENLKFLKICFRIEPGDFYYHAKDDVEIIIALQLYKIYRDGYITNEEALLKVDLQEIFDLTFDQMNEYAKSEAAISLQHGADIRNLDVFFTNKEYFKLRSAII